MYNHWFVSRQKRRLTMVYPALISFSGLCVGKEWSGNTELQLKLEDELQSHDITQHGTLRARRVGTGGGGIRTLFKELKDLGLVFLEDENGRCQLTLMGEDIVKNKISFADAMRHQLQRYQYPSATSWKGSGSVSHDFKVHPFQFIFRLLRDPRMNGKLMQDEMRYIVIHYAKSDSQACIDEVVSYILKYRASKELPQPINDEKKTYDNIANTFFNYITLTQYVDRGVGMLLVRQGAEQKIDAFIEASPKFIPHPEDSEIYQRAFGRGNQAKDLRDFNKNYSKTQKELYEALIRRAYVQLALSRPISGITHDLVITISDETGVDQKKVENFLVENYSKGNVDDFFVNYRELAHLGRSGAADFERATCEIFKDIFKMKVKHVGSIGNTPDVYVESSEEGFCGILDNKAYDNGYSISGDHERVMKDVYIPNVHSYGGSDYPLAFFSYISGSFGVNINSQLKKLHEETGIDGSAMPVDLLVDFAEDYNEKGYTHKDIRRIFSVNREVLLSDIEQLPSHG